MSSPCATRSQRFPESVLSPPARWSAGCTVVLNVHPAQTTPDAIAKSLTAAGYTPGALDAADGALQNKPAWATGGLRVTVTNPVDQAMSGDYRKY
jgi:hypothetical protein